MTENLVHAVVRCWRNKLRESVPVMNSCRYSLLQFHVSPFSEIIWMIASKACKLDPPYVPEVVDEKAGGTCGVQIFAEFLRLWSDGPCFKQYQLLKAFFWRWNMHSKRALSYFRHNFGLFICTCLFVKQFQPFETCKRSSTQSKQNMLAHNSSAYSIFPGHVKSFSDTLVTTH